MSALCQTQTKCAATNKVYSITSARACSGLEESDLRFLVAIQDRLMAAVVPLKPPSGHSLGAG